MHTQVARYESSVNRSFFVLLSQDVYRATSRYRISLVSSRFSTFMCLIQLKIFSTSQPWEVWHKASTLSSVKSINFCAGLLRSPLVFAGVEMSSVLYNFPGAHANPRGYTSCLQVARRHASSQACHPHNWPLGAPFIWLCATSKQKA